MRTKERQEQRFFSIKDLCHLCGKGESSIRTWINEHGLPVYRIGTSIMVERSEFEKWMADHKKVSESSDKKVNNAVKRLVGA